ncbi:LOW QUALITY PROTEIN: ubiquitin interaction domain-containing protein [Purpureocillium lavendulum]|uniref:Ubiquitin interaction domain-containing protein n=1 Tax=Purpureocillium lavendulum TaxID=1247861 RepID=A0AB34FJ46_9HYPO|nr:LOW QUALITY PROTEIN: ubiquitin interaction domain-containing protein [Purpureocillium lavendulum]
MHRTLKRLKMASREPTEEEISQILEVANFNPQDDRAMVIQALKSNGCNIETVLMQLFDNPVTFRQKYTQIWNESMFSADRDGSDNNAGIGEYNDDRASWARVLTRAAFHIESMGQNDVIQGVTPPPENYGAGAPSRPPSRSNDRSPLGRMVDWTAGPDAPGTADFLSRVNAALMRVSLGPSNAQSREDEDMQRALRESAQEAGIALPGQETGVVDSSSSAPYFGPANRGEYDQDNWAMVPTGTSNAGLPAPETRKRPAGVPALLVQGQSSFGEHRLGGLLTILHEIPLARNVLLQCGTPAASYGFNSEWWNGQEILPPEVLAKLQSGEISWGERNMVAPGGEDELHRLMAFLDSTERSYGTVSVLTDLIPYSSLGPEKQFYEHLTEQNAELIKPLTQVATLARVLGGSVSDDEAKFGLLEIEHLRSDYIHIKTLYESLDHIMWSDALAWGEVSDDSKMAVFKEMGEVITIKIGGDGPEDSVDMPLEFYPERYLESRKDEARRIQQGWCETKAQLNTVAMAQQNIYRWHNDWSQESFDRKDMLQKAIDQWTTYREYLTSRGRFRGMEQSGFDTDKYPDYRTAPSAMSEEEQKHLEKVEQVLKAANASVAEADAKMKVLNEQLERIRAKQRFLGRLLTDPNKKGRPRPMDCKKYLLRGVATPNDVVYLCKRSEPDLIELEDSPKALDQWWRLAYVPKEDQPVKAEKIEVERVLREMWQETKNPLLVYATEDALNTPRDPLSAPLDRFARAENKAFRQELNREAVDAGSRKPSVAEPISPSKRKHRSDSPDSMDSNRASIGSADQGGFDNAFEDNQDMSATEMMDMSGQHFSADADSTDVTPPIKPNRQPAVTESTSATLTPNTLPADDIDPVVGTTQGQAPLTTGVAMTERAPEMTERSRPPAFMTAQGSSAKDSGGEKGIDMEIPDHQD